MFSPSLKNIFLISSFWVIVSILQFLPCGFHLTYKGSILIRCLQWPLQYWGIYCCRSGEFLLQLCPILFCNKQCSVSILVFQVRMPVKYHQATFPLQKYHKTWNAIFQWYTQQHMNMVRANFCLYDLYTLFVTQLQQNPYDVFL